MYICFICFNSPDKKKIHLQDLYHGNTREKEVSTWKVERQNLQEWWVSKSYVKKQYFKNNYTSQIQLYYTRTLYYTALALSFLT